MRVIEVGPNAPENVWPKEATCAACGSKLELDPADIQGQTDQREGDYAWFVCPVDNERNYVDYKSYFLAAKKALAVRTPRYL